MPENRLCLPLTVAIPDELWLPFQADIASKRREICVFSEDPLRHPDEIGDSADIADQPRSFAGR